MLQSASAMISHCRKLLGTPEFGKDYMGLKMLDSIQVGRNLAEKISASLILPKSRKFWNTIVLNSFSGLFSTLGDKGLCWCKAFPDFSEDSIFSSYREHLITLPLLNKKPNCTHLLRYLLFLLVPSTYQDEFFSINFSFVMFSTNTEPRLVILKGKHPKSWRWLVGIRGLEVCLSLTEGLLFFFLYFQTKVISVKAEKRGSKSGQWGMAPWRPQYTGMIVKDSEREMMSNLV